MIHRSETSTVAFIFLSFLFLLMLSENGSSQVTTDSNEGSASAKEENFVHSMNPKENEKILLKKCCSLQQILNTSGSCVYHDKGAEINILIARLEQRILRNSPKDVGQRSKLYIEFLESDLNCDDQEVRIVPANYLQFTSSLQLILSNDDNSYSNSNGTLKESVIVDPQNFCIDWYLSEVSSETIAARLCRNDLCMFPSVEVSFSSHNPISRTSNNGNNSDKLLLPHFPHAARSSRPLCLRKCCPPLHAINMTDFTCVSYEIPWRLYPLRKNFVEEKHFTQNVEVPRLNPLPVNWITGPLNCPHSYEVYADKYDRYFINSEGTLIYEENGNVQKIPPGEFCFDAVILTSSVNEKRLEDEGSLKTSSSQLDSTATNGSTEEQYFKNPNLFFMQMALVCFEEDFPSATGEQKINWRTVYTILTGISSIFLLITCVVFTILRKDLNLPGWLQFAYALTLLLTFTLLTIAQLWTQRIHDISKGLCQALGYALHFFFLSSFGWLFSMNVDLGLSFRTTALVRGFGKGRGKRRFLEFSAFSIGFPAAVTLTLLAVDRCSSSQILTPSGIGETSCVIDMSNKVAQLHYFYGFVGVLLFVNLVIFVGTLNSLRNREKETRMAKRQSTSSSDYDRVQLFTRLFLIMGILWVFEVISWTFEYLEIDGNFRKIFVVTDCLNASQGIAVFLMFVWKKQTWKQLKKKFKSTFGIRGKRPLCRPNNGTMSSGGHTGPNGTSTKSSNISSTKSSDSSRLTSTSTFTQLDVESFTQK